MATATWFELHARPKRQKLLSIFVVTLTLLITVSWSTSLWLEPTYARGRESCEPMVELEYREDDVIFRFNLLLSECDSDRDRREMGHVRGYAGLRRCPAEKECNSVTRHFVCEKVHTRCGATLRISHPDLDVLTKYVGEAKWMTTGKRLRGGTYRITQQCQLVFRGSGLCL